MKPIPAVVLNMFHSGLGIARSLGERGIPVIGLSAERGVYGNFTRFARIRLAPNSRSHPEALLENLLSLGREIGRGVIFPTRDDDVVFLDRYREELQPYFSSVIPDRAAAQACLNKWETHQWAQKAGVAVPAAWLVEREADLERVMREAAFPCVMKPVASYHWHRGANWQLVGARKAVRICSREELVSEYSRIALADPRVLVQEVIPGTDNGLVITACYFDRQLHYVAGFNIQKLLQIPEGFGTGCIVQTIERPELVEPTVRLLGAMGFSGIAEVEFKWDAAAGEHKLIEINARPWDQHRLGHACGIDLIFIAYCDHAGLVAPAVGKAVPAQKWVDDDAILTEMFAFGGRHRKLGDLFQMSRGKRIWAIWSAKDPAPFAAYLVKVALPRMTRDAARMLWSGAGRILRGNRKPQKEAQIYENRLEKRRG